MILCFASIPMCTSSSVGSFSLFTLLLIVFFAASECHHWSFPMFPVMLSVCSQWKNSDVGTITHIYCVIGQIIYYGSSALTFK